MLALRSNGSWLPVLIIILMSAQRSLGAQQLFTVPLDSGILVRMRIADSSLVEGRLTQRLEPTSRDIFFCRYPANPCRSETDEGLRSLQMANIQGLEVASGSGWAHGAIIGAIVGGFVGLLGIAATSLCDTAMRCGNPGAIAVSSLLGGALWGILFGSTHVVWRAAP